MTERDEFAKAALVGLLTIAGGVVVDSDDTVKAITRSAYKYADQMMVYREMPVKDIPIVGPKIPGQGNIVQASGMIKP